MNLHCQNILLRAVKFRLGLAYTKGHNYTGNLINSIVVILYDDGEISNIWTAGEDGQIKKPKFQKMTARKKKYYYSNDYSNVSSRYKAEVPTNRGVADEDIESFINTNEPSIKKGWSITVAYTVEYASWVEQEHGTTGYLLTQKFAGMQLRQSFKQIG